MLSPEHDEGGRIKALDDIDRPFSIAGQTANAARPREELTAS
ncbi:MAG: hypothetical protein AVDCRST_MAG73-305 [uncultured Thermomicrobiales bacterium]|uniref:Uncharacterized protein n=1 Tax=uncultured Thermomicrobiales bacterium TaxID=1645740 RepID=A0A6J4TI29_9BACT|nr:MAG: hypothetical protein AVDCRST_MAG73-305 [uncultured Thermomicrobiales bacterium]